MNIFYTHRKIIAPRSFIIYLISLFLHLPIIAFSQVSDNPDKNRIEWIKWDIDSCTRIVEKDAAISFIRNEFIVQNDIHLRLKSQNKKELYDFNGQPIINQTYEQYYNNIRIERADIKLRYINNKLSRVKGGFVQQLDLITVPAISEAEAYEIAKEYIGATEYLWDLSVLQSRGDSSTFKFDLRIPELVISQDFLIDRNALKLAYKFDIIGLSTNSRNYVYVDALSGDVIRDKNLNFKSSSVDATATSRYYSTHTIKTKQALFGGDYFLFDNTRGDGLRTVNLNGNTNVTYSEQYYDEDNNWTETEYHNANKDDAALDAHWSLMKTYDFFNNSFCRDSYDDNGSQVWVCMNYGHPDLLNNAAWSSGYIQIGESDGIDWDPLSCIEVIAHEFTHGIIETHIDIENYGISGSIMEGICNIFGACIEGYALPSCGVDMWYAGEVADLRTGSSGAFSLMDPHYNNQPEFVGESTYWIDPTGCIPSSTNDCYAHHNCSIVNYWFYILSTGDYSGISISPMGASAAAFLVYYTLVDEMNDNTDTFEEFRQCTEDAVDLYWGNCSSFAESVANSWYAVGVGDSYIAPVEDISNQTISTTQTYTGCSFEISNVTVSNSSTLNIDHSRGVLIDADFQITFGSGLSIY